MPDFQTIATQELRRPKRRDQVTIPDPVATVESLHATVSAMKELLETLAGQRGRPNDAAITWDDMLRLQKITNADIPKDIGTSTVSR